MIKIQNLSKIYRNDTKEFYALNNINIHINSGEIFGFIGESGAGKSTLIRTINLLEQPSNGNIIINGIDITKLNKNAIREKRKEMGMIFQSFNLFDSKTVFENIAYPLRINGISTEEIIHIVEELLEVVDLKDKKNHFPNNLSGGQKQRVAIARALATNPSILLCDEPTSALDPKTTKSILNLIKEVQKKYKITVIIITHEMDVIKTICDKVAVIDKGEIIELGKVKEVFANPSKKVTKEFIGHIHENIDDLRSFRNNTNYLYRLSFSEDSAAKPLITKFSTKFGIDVNILAGNINTLKNTKIGYLIVEISKEKVNPSEVEKWFKDNHVLMEEIIWLSY